MKHLILGLVLLTSFASARNGGEPTSQHLNIKNKQDMAIYHLKSVDIAALLNKNLPKAYSNKPVKFATSNVTMITPESHGTWTQVPDGKIWNLRFTSKNATDINFGFTKFYLPKGVELHFLSYVKKDPNFYDGPYTYEDNQDYKQFWSAPLPGGDVALELFVPNGISEKIELELTKVSTGFRDVFKMFNGDGLIPKQGTCNNDVVCAVGDPWRDEIRAVAAYTLNGIDQCTGTMVMDAESSFTPYFLTAAHCSVTAINAATMVTIWNYESANCGDLSGGSRLNTVSGAIFKSRRTNVDVGLVELASTPPEAFGVYWSGWDATGNAPNGSVGIHHPNVDEKAISFNNDPLTSVGSCIVQGTPPPDTHWRVDNWEDGTTEPGSSGSGLWDPGTHLLVGFLSGGTASCTNITNDCYGKVSEAWDDGSGAAGNLKHWLDPNNTGAMTQAGSDPTPFSLVSVDTIFEVCANDAAGSTLNVETNGIFNGPVTLSVATTPAEVTNFAYASTSINPTPGSTTFTFDAAAAGTTGNHTLTLQGDGDDNGVGVTAIVDLTISYSGGATAATNLTAPADNATDAPLTMTFDWVADANATSYRLLVSDMSDFSNILIDETVETNSYTNDVDLPTDADIYWKVETISGCNVTNPESNVFQFHTLAVYCFTVPTAIPDNTPAGVDLSISIATTGLLASITTSIKSDHTWPGDLIFTLSHAGTGAIIYDRPGVPLVNTVGCNIPVIDAILDDTATSLVEDACPVTGTLSPNAPLAGLAGVDFSGNWTLNISDNANLDTGSITEFCIVPSFVMPDLIFANGFE